MRISDWSSDVCSSDLGWTLKSDQTLPAIFQPRDFLLQIIETDADHIVLCIPAQEWSIVRSMLFLGRCLEALDDQHPEFINSLDSALNFGDFDELHIVPPVPHGYNGAQFRQQIGRKSTRLNSSHYCASHMTSYA